MATKLGRMMGYLWSLGLARSYETIKPLYLLYYNAYDHQTWQAGDLP